jgi:hypothetical protein
MTPRAVRGLGGLALVLLAACKRTPPPGAEAGAPAAPIVQAVPGAPVAPGAPIAPADTSAPADPTPPRDLPSVELQPTGPFELEVGVEVVPGKTIAAPKVDPFDDAVAAVRASAVGCFAGLPPGAYAASLMVAVTPAGNAGTIAVTSGPEDPAVRKCLEQAASRSYPTSADGRKLSIDVRVSG